MGADSPNWRVESAVPPSMPPPLPAPHQECVDFLYRGDVFTGFLLSILRSRCVYVYVRA